MSAQPLFYPASPVNVSATITTPSAAFKKEVSKVMGSVVLFFVVYLLLILLSVLLAIKRLKNEDPLLKVYVKTWMESGAFDHSPQQVSTESWGDINEHIFRKFKNLLQVQQVYLMH